MSIENFRKNQQRGIWVYCQDCKRCYLTGEEREIDNELWCAYDDCEFGDIYDAVEWTIMRKSYPDFPEQPQRNVLYKPA